ncbi:hypothetical protein ACLIYM_20385 [Streptomyces fenghuangensis]|uniref:hypothetical protein n=1 Tax=Streptomyces sp. ICN903 TaxID=2964654 RepID=UPI001EDBFC4A|nr:hypothetical protein [Streptomyces sp. ICN903]MCG3042525.1 hypothetical protein [Streptomyces sp. ICN903]
MKDSDQVGEQRIGEAEAARDALAEALRQAGIRFPAVDVRTPVRVDGATGYAMVVLGECSAPVARELAAVIERGAV